jgi:hypothetical protein
VLVLVLGGLMRRIALVLLSYSEEIAILAFISCSGCAYVAPSFFQLVSGNADLGTSAKKVSYKS